MAGEMATELFSLIWTVHIRLNSSVAISTAIASLPIFCVALSRTDIAEQILCSGETSYKERNLSVGPQCRPLYVFVQTL